MTINLGNPPVAATSGELQQIRDDLGVSAVGGVFNAVALAAALAGTEIQRTLDLLHSTPEVTVTAPSASWTSVTASDNGSGKLRLSSTVSNHLLTGANAVGKKVLMISSAGVPSGLYDVLAVTTVTPWQIDLDVAYVATTVTGMGYTGGANRVPLINMTVPGNLLGTIGDVLQLSMHLSMTNSANTKTMYVLAGHTITGSTPTPSNTAGLIAATTGGYYSAGAMNIVTSGAYTTTNSTAPSVTIRLAAGGILRAGPMVGSSAMTNQTVTPSADFKLSVCVTFANPDEFVTLHGIDVLGRIQ